MAIPTTREEFSEYCLRKLGEPVIKVNVAPEQVDDRISEALYRFYERHYNAVEPLFMVVVPSDADVTLGYVTLPSDVIAVTDAFRPTRSGGLFSTDYQLFTDTVYGSGVFSKYRDLPNYYISQMNLGLIRQLFAPEREFSFSPITNKFIIAGGLKDLVATDGAIILRGFKRVLGEASLSDPTNSEIHNIWKERWVQNYATALIKEQWASNLLKFRDVQMIGGVSMNGEYLKQEAKEELEKLEEQLQEEYSEPIDFVFA